MLLGPGVIDAMNANIIKEGKKSIKFLLSLFCLGSFDSGAPDRRVTSVQ